LRTGSTSCKFSVSGGFCGFQNITPLLQEKCIGQRLVEQNRRHDDQAALRFCALNVFANFSCVAPVDHIRRLMAAFRYCGYSLRVGLPIFECVLPMPKTLFGIKI
jgi:hypothetical protein